MYFVEKDLGNKSTRDKAPIKLLKTPALMASGISTKLLPKFLNELFDRLKLLLQKKKAGKKSNINNEEIVAVVDKLLEYKCISTKQSSALVELFSKP